MLAIPAFQARTQTALFRAGNKPPLEVVVANLKHLIFEIKYLVFDRKNIQILLCCYQGIGQLTSLVQMQSLCRSIW